MRQSRKTIAAAAMAAAMIAGITVGEARAYFTTYATAMGSHQITVGPESQIKEKFSEWTKHIVLANTGDAPCYVRAKAFAGSIYRLEYTGDGKWSEGEDGYWYYEEILPVGGETEPLDIRIVLPTVTETDMEGNPLPYTEDFNVVVIQECTAVLYTENGEPYADWDAVMDSDRDSYEWEEGGTRDE